MNTKGIEVTESHYVWVKNLSALITSNSNIEHHICYICLNHFSSDKALANHQEACKNHLPGRIVIPKDVKDLTVEFRNFRGKMIKPFVGYADFEALINKQTKELQEVVVNAVNGEYTATDTKKVEHTFEQHQVHSYAIQIVSQYESLIDEYMKISKQNINSSKVKR